jgi:nitrous oxide reductase accessory protein NosL
MIGRGPLRWRNPVGHLAALTLLALLAGCGGDPGTGPIEVRWDRTTCERCRMVLSDRHHGAQVRLPPAQGRSRVLPFDDIGCALVWLESQPGKDDPGIELWVNDWRTGAWIDARRATYLPGQVTPMEYGLGAQADPDPNGLDFAQARERVLAQERRQALHGAHLRGEPRGR